MTCSVRWLVALCVAACSGGGEASTTVARSGNTTGAAPATGSGPRPTASGSVTVPAAATTVTPPGTTPSSWTPAGNGIRWKRTVLPYESGSELEWLVVRVEVPNVNVRAILAPGETVALPPGDARTLVVVNSGFFDPQHRPSGTLISGGTDIAGANPQGGSGTLVIRSGRAEIMDAAAPIIRSPAIDLAVQCGPRLIETNGSPGIYRDDGHRFARTAVCTRDAGRTLDFVLTWQRGSPMRGPGLFAFSRMLLTVPSPTGDSSACQSALNLDGGPSTGIVVRGAPAASHPPIGPVPFVITIAPARP